MYSQPQRITDPGKKREPKTGPGRLTPLLVLIMAYALFLYYLPLAAQPPPTFSYTPIHVALEQGKLTLDAQNAPLAQVLQLIAEEANLELALSGDLSAPVTHSFADVPLDDAIRRLARGYSFALTYAAPSEERGAKNLTGLWVMGSAARAEPFAQINVTPVAPTLSLGSEQPSATLPPQTNKSRHAAWVSEIQTLADVARGGNRAAISHLGDIIASEPNAEVRAQAVAALAGLKGTAVETLLVQALRDVDVSVRVRAVRGLRVQGSAAATQSLSMALSDDANPQVRLAAVRALSSLPSRAALAGLEKASSDPDGSVRQTAARTLSWWKANLPRLE